MIGTVRQVGYKMVLPPRPESAQAFATAAELETMFA
jgi:hypothetical protein